MLQKYCDFLEERSLNRISEREFNEKVIDWRKMVRSKMPKFYRMQARVIFFNFYETEIIRRLINEDLEYFFNSKIKNLMFATSSRVYAYLNQIVSVRIILAKFWKIPLEDINDNEEIKVYKEELLIDPNAPIEEEKDSDEDEEPEEETKDDHETDKTKTQGKDGKTIKGKETTNPGTSNLNNQKPTKEIKNLTVDNK